MYNTQFLRPNEVHNKRSIVDLVGSAEISYSLIGIVAKETRKYQSGYEVAEHVAGNITLVIVDTVAGNRQYISLNLGPRKPEGAPGITLIEYIKENYPELETLITGRDLVYSDKGRIKNETAEPGTDIEKVIERYSKSERTELKAESNKDKSAKPDSESESADEANSDEAGEPTEGSGEE